MTADPYQASAGASDPGSWNRYAYVQGDPVNFVDPEGLAREGPGPGFPVWFWEWFLRDNPNTLVRQQSEPGKKADEPLHVTNFSTTSKEATGVQNSLRWLAAAIAMDADCNGWLKNNGDVINILLGERSDSTQVWVGVANLSENTVNAVAGQGGTDLPAGTALLTVNRNGAYFNTGATTNNGRIKGGTDEARAFILLHELAHLTSEAGFLDNDRVTERQTTNNNLVQEHCGSVINRAAVR